jgi:hypothetical protein
MKFRVLNEVDTLRAVRAEGRSLARFGDGEIKLAVLAQPSPGQIYVPTLARRLAEVATSKSDSLVVAIPRIFDGMPAAKVDSWKRWTERERTVLWRKGRVYGSAFVSRPDFSGAPFEPDYWRLMRSIWDGRPALLVRGSAKRPELFDNVASLELLIGPPSNAWCQFGNLLAACLLWAGQPKNAGGIVLMQLGPTATVLAHDLALEGVQALDLGKASRFYRAEVARAEPA